MDVDGRGHDARADDGVDELLDNDGRHERDHGNERRDEQPDHRCKCTAEPRADDRNDIEQACDYAQRHVVGYPEDSEADAAPEPDDRALQKRAFDITAHNARERDMEELERLFVLGPEQALELAAERGQLHENPEGNDKRKADSDERVRHARPEGDHAACALACHVGRGVGKRAERRFEPLVDGVVLEHVGIAFVHAA